jgi:bifunctional non-homologous end joining protein LigD
MPTRKPSGSDSLEEYRTKRDFSVSPEPAGIAQAARSPEPAGAARRDQLPGPARLFCVQKHLASQLHYDFRLEHNGVLLSWAVPKGPSLNPADKRLAMHVEDHPLDYGDFEGVIPEGYGAGIVMLWDTGTWEPEVDDVDAALRKGDLKFTLHGVKLKGSWVLVRTRWPSQDDNRGWLLIKHRDDWAGPVDVTQAAPLSVKSFGDFEDILAADNPEVWQSDRPAKGGAAGAMLAKIIEKAAQKRLAGQSTSKDQDGPASEPAGATDEARKAKPASAETRKAKPAPPKARRAKSSSPKARSSKSKG